MRASACCRNFHHPPGQRQQKEKERTCSDRSAPSARSATGQQLQESQKAQRPDQIGACTDRRAEGHCTGARPSAFLFGPCTARFSFGKTDKGSRRAPHGGERRSAQAHGVGAEVPLGCKGAGAVFAVHGNGAERTLRRRHGGASRWTSPPWPGRPIHAPRMLTDPPATAAWTCTGVRPARGRVLRWEWCGAGYPPPPGPGW